MKIETIIERKQEKAAFTEFSRQTLNNSEIDSKTNHTVINSETYFKFTGALKLIYSADDFVLAKPDLKFMYGRFQTMYAAV